MAQQRWDILYTKAIKNIRKEWLTEFLTNPEAKSLDMDNVHIWKEGGKFWQVIGKTRNKQYVFDNAQDVYEFWRARKGWME